MKADLEAGERRRQNRVLLASVLGTTASVFPAFLTAAVAVQLSADLGLDEAGLGLAIGVSFGSASVASAVLGRVAERMGAIRAMTTGLAVTALVEVVIVVWVASPAALTVTLAVAGMTNALTQPAANLLLAGRLPPERLGVAFAVKQAGMPTASLLGGLAVPALALTLGWRSTFVAGIVLVVAAVCALPRGVEVERRRGGASVRAARPDLGGDLLLRFAAVGLLGAATAGAMVSFLVTTAEASGLSPAQAALLLTGGSVVGVASRLAHGLGIDRGRFTPIRRVSLLFAIGAAGLIVFAVDQPWAYVLGVVPAFAAGWAWPGLFNLSVVRWNPTAPAAATGITQTGVYVGAGAGPVLGGLVLTGAGPAVFWSVAAVTLAGAALLSVDLRRRLVATAAA